ncbi:MAG: prolyl oligopeptidase family serine peptidase [Microscillaceae bacterium]|jgi:dipeptidyl aminopeptidase/acylaminoacyl peptidase|nr:prolyl oligopeptidase family serine peptidase [Microscillaceae bacterium]
MKRIYGTLICFFLTLVAFAQTKKPLSHEVYDGWNSISERGVSNDGKWMFYVIKPQEGDANLVAQDLANPKDRTKTFARGEQGKLTEDSRFVIFKIKPQLDSTKALRRKKTKEDKLPKDSLGIYDWAKDTLVKIPRVKSYLTPKKAAGWLAYQLEEELPISAKKTAKPDTAQKADTLKKIDTQPEIKKVKNEIEKNKSRKEKEKEKNNPKNKEKEENQTEQPIDSTQKPLSELEIAQQKIQELNNELEKIKKEKAEAEKKKNEKPKKAPKKEGKDTGTRLILRNLATAKQDTFLFVTEYIFDEKATKLAFASTGNDTTFKAGVYIFDLKKGDLQWVFPKAGKHKNLVFDEQGQQLAFVADTDTTKKNEKALVRYWELYHWQERTKEASLLADKNTINPTWLVNEFYKLNFSKDGSKLFFGTNPTPPIKDTTLLPEEIVMVDVWTHRDGKLQPQQNVELKNEAQKSYLAVAYPKLRKIYQLGSPDLPTVVPSGEGNADNALGVSTLPYDKIAAWDGYPAYVDLYLVNTKDGKRRKIKEKLKAITGISPAGNYLYWYSPADSSWFTYSIRSSQLVNLTKNIRNKFYDELHDSPELPSAYGTMGWTENDAQFLIYDRYDAWQFDPENRTPAKRITQNGRETKITFRYVRLDPEEKFLKLENPILFRATDNETKAEGYFSYQLNKNDAPRKLIFDDYHFANLTKAKEANRYVFTRESFTDFPDLYVSDNSFTKLNRLSNANPQQSKYYWGSVELVKWTSLNGEELQGLLYKPEGFDPGKKYPMVVYYYERDSDLLHYYTTPAPSASTVNETMFTSNGYLIFDPDIPYKIGHPGQSAYDAIVSGVSHLIGQGFVDRDKIGLQGQSWGGYQTVHLITRTDLFACAMAGAPVVNMTSAYGGIRYGTGFSRMFQYEKSQSRIGATLWEKPLLYLENSPLFHLDKVKTPLLIMHNDKDGAVPYTQGIELFMGLKRLGKPVWMLTYNEEDHNLIQRKNRKDLSVRMMQFFDYYLKYAPEPYWMRNGVPANEKGINKRYELMGEK